MISAKYLPNLCLISARLHKKSETEADTSAKKKFICHIIYISKQKVLTN